MHLVKIDDAVVAVKIGLQNAAQKTRPPTLAPQPRVVLDPSTANQPPQALTQSSLNDLTQASAGSHTSIFGTDDAGSPVEKEGNAGSVVFLPREELAALLPRGPWACTCSDGGHEANRRRRDADLGTSGSRPARAGGCRLLPQDLRDRTRGTACVACHCSTLAK
jgi:hypothetical protein